MGKGKACPKCGSKNVAPFMGFETGMRYECMDCGYVGVFVIERAPRPK